MKTFRAGARHEAINGLRSRVAYGACAIALTACAGVQQRSRERHEPLRVLAIGDSVTQGRRGNGVLGDRDGPTLSWRYPFWKALRMQDGFEMVGTLQHGFEGDPDWPSVDGVAFDRDHESQWGWELDEVTAMLRDHLPSLRADVAIVVLGGNDLMKGESVEQVFAEWRKLLALLRAHEPKIAIIIGAVCADFEPLASYRRALFAAVPTFATAQSPVIAADGCANWVSNPERPDADTVDWIHPNMRGDEKIAQAFLEAMRPWLRSSTRRKP
jgi:lysophospholipase L1-like esterase